MNFKAGWAKPFALVVGAVAFLSVAWALWLVLQTNEQLLSIVFRQQVPLTPDKDVYPVFTQQPQKTYHLAAIVRGRTPAVGQSPENTSTAGPVM